MRAHVADLHVAPDALLRQRMALNGHMAGLRKGQLKNQAAAVVCYPAHDIQSPRSPRDKDWVL